MTNNNNTFAETTIVAFHIGRGGHFHNAGFVAFIGEEKIGKFIDALFPRFELQQQCLKEVKEKFTEYFWANAEIDGRKDMESYFTDLITDEQFDKLEEVFGISKDDLGDVLYYDAVGHEVGLSESDVQEGIGSINIDNEYNSTYTRHLINCSDEELRLIADYSGYVDGNIRDYAKEQLGIIDEEKTED